MASKPGKVFKREDILDKIWGNEVVVGGRTIDVHIRKLREKLGDKRFKTIKGVGYKFENKLLMYHLLFLLFQLADGTIEYFSLPI